MTAAAAKGAIMVFARAPVPGKTKTRLIPALGEQGAAQLHARLIERTLERLTAVADADVSLWCTPSGEDSCLQAYARVCGATVQLQRGSDLGRRMQFAFADTLQTAPWAIVVGTDCPDMQTADAEQAAADLQKGTDAVIGPAFDGGYYLLGLRRLSPALFTDVPWGTDQVWPTTRERLQRLGWSWSTVTRRRDLDRPDDLGYFPGLCPAISEPTTR